MNILKKTTLAVALLATAATGAQAFADTDDAKLTRIDRAELQELRESGDREAFREKLEELGIEPRDRPELTDEQKETIKELKESGDREAIKEQMEAWGFEAPEKAMGGKGLHAGEAFQDLTDDQKEELKELRESGDHDAVREKLEEFGIEMPESKDRVELTDEQKETIKELKESGDREALEEYYEELGLGKKVRTMKKRAHFEDSLTDDEKEALEEAREIARAGDTETAEEMIQEIFDNNDDLEEPARGIAAFFKRIFDH